MRVFVFLLLIIGLFDSCLQSRSSGCQSRLVTAKVTGLAEVIRDYRKLNIQELGLVSIESKLSYDTTILFMASTLFLDAIPGHYMIVDEIPVLVYTSQEKVFEFDREYSFCILSLVRPYLDSTFAEMDTSANNSSELYLPPNYSPVLWKLSVVNNTIVSMIKYE